MRTNGKWRIVYAYDKLNTAILPADISFPRKDVLQNDIFGCTRFSALDLVDVITNCSCKPAIYL